MSTSETDPPSVFSYTRQDEERILQSLVSDCSFLSNPSINELKKIYEASNKRIASMELHLATLAEYYRAHRIPRGIRSQLKPNLFPMDSTFAQKFSQISNKYALDIILLNLEYLQHELVGARQRHMTTETELRNKLTTHDFDSYMTNCGTYISKFKNDQEATKRRKWLRDEEDYRRGNIYNWQDPKGLKRYNQGNVGSKPGPYKNRAKHNNLPVENLQDPQPNTSFLEVDMDPKGPDEGAKGITNGEKTQEQRPIKNRSTRKRT